MGGCPPLGYDIDSRKLIVNVAEAKTVNLIFRRYLDLGCVRALRDDLADRRIVSKVWTSTSGRAHGGTPFDRGALYCLLKNRVYIGETTHKGKSYPGEHNGIVARELFDAVQERLAASRRRTLGKVSVPQEAPLAGMIFDDRGTAMAPTYSMKPGGRRYCYYASRQADGPSGRAISRVPAAAIEGLLAATLGRLGCRVLVEKTQPTFGRSFGALRSDRTMSSYVSTARPLFSAHGQARRRASVSAT